MSRKLLARIACGTLILLFVIYVCDFAMEWHRRLVAQQLIHEVQQWQVGVTTQDEVNRVLKGFGKRLNADNASSSSDLGTLSASLNLSSPYLLIVGEERRLPGRRRWAINSTVAVKNQRLSEAYIRMLIRRSDGVYLLTAIHPSLEDPASEVSPYFVSMPHVTGPPTEALNVHLGEQPTAAERVRAFDINFSCLTARECRHVCDVMPGAWQDLIARNPKADQDQAGADCRR